MKKKCVFPVFLAAVLAAAAFAACSGPSSDGSSGSSDAGSSSVSSSELSDVGPVQIYMPDGAPALSLAKYMNEGGDGAEYHVVDSSTIQTYVTGNSPAADLCILPLNLASKLLGTGETYKMLGTVTHGNLYMLSTDETVQYTTENLSGLIGKTVGVVQLPNVPGLTFKVILNQNDIAWQELTGDDAPASDKVNLKAVTPDQVSPATGYDCYVAPEPAASVKVDKTPLAFVGDLQALYGGEKGYPQAVLVGKNTFIAEESEWVENFLAGLDEAAEWLFDTEASVIVDAVSSHLTEGLTPQLSVANLSATAIEHSGIRFESAADGKDEVNAFLAKMMAVSANSASAVSDAFYYLP